MADKRLELVNALLRAARTGKTVWRGGDGREENEQAFSFQGRSGGARIYPKDWDWVAPYVLQLLDENGATVDSWNSQDESDDLKVAIGRLYDAAKASAVNKVVDSLLSELAEDEPPF